MPPTGVRRPRTASELVTAGRVTAEQAYAASLVLARLHDHGMAHTLTLEEMCEILGYAGTGRRPKGVPRDRHAPRQARGRGLAG